MNLKKLLFRVIGPVIVAGLAAAAGVALTRPTPEVVEDYDVPTDAEPANAEYATTVVAPVKRAPKAPKES